MIYTVTFNPSLDYIVSVKDLQMGMTNRTDSELLLPGGKGINVSLVLKNLGILSTAFGFLAGFTGEEIARKLRVAGIQPAFIQLAQGVSRINIKLKSVDGTEINGQGPDIDSQNLEDLMQKLDGLRDGDVLVLAGSIPASLPDDIYQTIMKRLEGANILIAVDATKDLLLNVLPYRPFVIKPNHHELGEIFDVTLETFEEVIPYAKKLQEQGARNVLVSMGKKGGLLLAENGEIIAGPSTDGIIINSVGAGDSMVAGFLTGWLEQHNYEYAFKMGMAAGGATAYSDYLGTKEEIEAVFQKLETQILCS